MANITHAVRDMFTRARLQRERKALEGLPPAGPKNRELANAFMDTYRRPDEDELVAKGGSDADKP